MIFNMTGGGAALNFKVVPNPQPDTAKENTIWVDTDRINNYYFSATQPENMVNYDVWFHVGTSSTVEFNALRKNGIQVYPLSAKQYINDSLVEKTAKSYQGGEWVDWITYLYNSGDLCSDITGGWHTQAKLLCNTHKDQYVAPLFTNYADYANVQGLTGGGGICKTVNLVDLSEMSAIRFYGSSRSANTDTKCYLFVCNSNFGVIAKVALGTETHSPTELPIKSAGKCYVGFETFSEAENITINKIGLVRS